MADHGNYGSGPCVARIAIVTWIGPDDYHLSRITRDRRTRLGYRTRRHHRNERWNVAGGS